MKLNERNIIFKFEIRKEEERNKKEFVINKYNKWMEMPITQSFLFFSDTLMKYLFMNFHIYRKKRKTQ